MRRARLRSGSSTTAQATRLRQLVRAEFPWVHLERGERNLGFGGAVNLVAARTAHPWIVAANADTAIRPGALQALLDAGEASRSRCSGPAPGVARRLDPALGALVSEPAAGACLQLRNRRLLPGLGDRLCLEGYWDPERSRAVDWAHAAFLAIRREAWEAAGGFDPSQWMYGEDLDLGWRLGEAGWTTLYEPSAQVSHALGAATRHAFAEERSARHIAATYLWMRRRRGAVRARAYAALNSAGAYFRWLLLSVGVRVRPRRFEAGRRTALHHARLHRLGLTASTQRLGEVVKPGEGVDQPPFPSA